MDSACLPNTAAYTFNGGHVGGQAIFESVHPPLTQGGGGRRRRAARKSTRRRRSARKVARKTARRSARKAARKTARRSARKVARKNTRRTARRTAKRTALRTAKRTTRRSARRVQGRRAVYREADKSMMTGAGNKLAALGRLVGAVGGLKENAKASLAKVLNAAPPEENHEDPQ